MNQTISTLSLGVRRFFFAQETPFGMALMRMFLPLAASYPMFMRAGRVRELFTSDGATAQLPFLNGWGDALPVLSPNLAIPLYGMMLACLVLAAVGFKTRWSLLIGTPLYIYFNMLDAVSTMTKYSVIASHLLVILSVSNCGAVWSMDAFLHRQKNGTTIPPTFPIWPARLAQMMFAFMYFGAAITKMQTAGFFTGAQLRYWMLTNWNYDNPIGETMAMWTPLLLAGAYLTMAWEFLFCSLVWRPAFRIPVLVIGVGFHLLTSVMLGLFVFPAICLAGYLAFVNEDDVVAARRWLRRFRLTGMTSWPTIICERISTGRRVLPPNVIWLCVLGFAGIGLAELEVHADLYGYAQSHRGLPLKVIDESIAKTMIRDNRRVREKDKFFDFAIGTFTVGGQLANRAKQFSYGDVMIAQCSLNPPHEDLWVECLLQDDAGRTIEQFGQFVQRQSMLADFSYRLGNKLLPGPYSMVLKSANQEIARRSFELVGAPSNTPSSSKNVFAN